MTDEAIEAARPLMVGSVSEPLGIWRFSDPPTSEELLDAYVSACERLAEAIKPYGEAIEALMRANDDACPECWVFPHLRPHATDCTIGNLLAPAPKDAS